MKPDEIPTAARDTCRTCHQPIIWTTTDRGRPMPVDAQPHPNSTIALTVQGDTVRSHVVKPTLAFGRTDLHRSHFAACPQADKWRHAKTAARPSGGVR